MAVTALELELAIAVSGFRDAECGSNTVRVDDVPGVGLVPVIIHWHDERGWWCPVLGGGPAAERVSLDLLDALETVMGVADYGEPVLHEFAPAAA
jgi:hypothetical protein